MQWSSGDHKVIKSYVDLFFCEIQQLSKSGFFAQEIEAVGDIYENPELLEDK